MEKNDSPTPAFRVTRQSGGLQVSMPVKPHLFGALLNLLWLLVWIPCEIAIIISLLGSVGVPESGPSVSPVVAGLFLAAFTVAGGLVLWRWIWSVGGREVLVVGRDALWARREIWGFGRWEKFDLYRIMSVKAGPLKSRFIDPSWGRMFIGHEGSEIAINCAGRIHAYGRGLEEAEAGDLVDILLEEMGFHFHKELIQREEPVFFL